MKPRAALLLAAGAAATAAHAALPVQVEDNLGFRRGAFVARGMTARPVGMGEAYTAVADDAAAISWNPAGLARIARWQAAAMYDTADNGVNLSYAAAAVPVGSGTAGASVTALNWGTWDVRDATGLRTGSGSGMDLALALAYAFTLPGRMGGSAGFAVERVSEAVGGSLFGLSAGGQLPVGDALTAAFSLQHFGPKADGFSLPAAARAGAAWTGVANTTLALDAGYGLTDHAVIVAAGAETRVLRMFALRAGFKKELANDALTGLTGLTLGVGFRRGRLGIDYAFQPFGDLAVSHRISLLYGLGPSADVVREIEFRDAQPVGVSTLGEKATVGAIPSAELENNAEQAYRDAAARAAAGDTAGARDRAQTAVELNPFHWQAWQLLGNEKQAGGDTDGALKAYVESLKIHPDNPELKAYATQLQASVLAARKTPATKPVLPAPGAGGLDAAQAAYAAGDVDGAWAKVAPVLQAEPGNAAAWQLLGNCQYAKGDAAGALTSWKYALSLNPDNPTLKSFVDSLAK